jgi:hypothetical protein
MLRLESLQSNASSITPFVGLLFADNRIEAIP